MKLSPRQRYAIWHAEGGLQFLRRVDFELCSICNLHCAYCSLQRRKNYPAFMPLDLYQRVLAELAQTPLQALGLYFSGESLLHPEFDGILQQTRECLDRQPEFRPLVYMHTNGVLWTPARTDAILARGVLHRVIWSIDGVDEATFNRIRPGAPYRRLLDQFEYLLAHRPPGLEVWVNNMVDAGCQSLKPDPRLQALLARADQVRTYFPYDLSEGPSHGYYHTRPEVGFCCYSLDTMVVTAAGQLSLCCVDLNARNAFGNLYEQSFAEIYNGPIHRQWMEWMNQGRRARLPGCAHCTVGEGVDGFAFGTPLTAPPAVKGEQA